MRIGLLYYPKLDKGGVEKHIQSLLNANRDSEIDYVVISATSQLFRESIQKSGVELIAWRPKNLSDKQALIALKNIIQQSNLDILHVHSPAAGILIHKITKNNDIPIIQTLHLGYANFFAGNLDTLWRKIRGTYYAIVEKNLTKHFFTKTIFVARQAYQSAINSGSLPDQTAIFIPNGIDINKYDGISKSNARDTFSIPEGKIILTCIGRLSRQKGQDILLKAVAKLPKNIDIELWLVGDGPDKSKLDTLISKLKVTENIKFLGYQKDVSPILAASDIFILPSRYDAYPYVLLEAMASGTACIASDVGDISNIIEPEKSGMLVPPGNIGSLSDAVINMIKDKHLRETLGQAGKLKISAMATEQAMISATHKVYKSAIN
ncbi:MAG: glycosyltransferase family 4 protein [Chloroflexota bacterium]